MFPGVVRDGPGVLVGSVRTANPIHALVEKRLRGSSCLRFDVGEAAKDAARETV